MPIFWYKDNDKQEFEKAFNITHSRCYTEYGFKRTGCVGCPYSKQIFKEMNGKQRKEKLLKKKE